MSKLTHVDRFIAEWRQAWRQHERETKAALEDGKHSIMDITTGKVEYEMVPLPEPPFAQARDVDMLIAEIYRLRRKRAVRGEK